MSSFLGPWPIFYVTIYGRSTRPANVSPPALPIRWQITFLRVNGSARRWPDDRLTATAASHSKPDPKKKTRPCRMSIDRLQQRNFSQNFYNRRQKFYSDAKYVAAVSHRGGRFVNLLTLFGHWNIFCFFFKGKPLVISLSVYALPTASSLPLLKIDWWPLRNKEEDTTLQLPI